MEILFKHTWIFFIVATIVNGIIFKVRSKKYIAKAPELKKGYDKIIKAWVIYANIPWLIMMMGMLSGSTQDTFEYLNPKAMNPMVLLFHFSAIVLWALSAWWIYFDNGAEFLEKHPGIIQKSDTNGTSDLSAKQIKLYFPIIILGGIIAMIMMWVNGFPTPPI